MADETVTAKCYTHRRFVKPGSREGVLIHDGGNQEGPCSGARFTMRREWEATREEAIAALTAQEKP